LQHEKVANAFLDFRCDIHTKTLYRVASDYRTLTNSPGMVNSEEGKAYCTSLKSLLKWMRAARKTNNPHYEGVEWG